MNICRTEGKKVIDITDGDVDKPYYNELDHKKKVKKEKKYPSSLYV